MCVCVCVYVYVCNILRVITATEHTVHLRLRNSVS